MITNTHSVGVVRDAVIAWRVQACARRTTKATGGRCRSSPKPRTADLNDINGFHVKPEHVIPRPRQRARRPGRRRQRRRRHRHDLLRIQRRHRHLVARARREVRRLHRRRAGAVQLRPAQPAAHRRRSGGPGDSRRAHRSQTKTSGSIIVVVATDAPLIPTQLKRVARRVSLGLGSDGSFAGDGSGDIFIAFSTANPGANGIDRRAPAHHAAQQRLNPIFLATVQATEEAIVNAMVAAEDHEGHQRSRGHRPAARPAARGAEEIQPAAK